jgi:hypothetical protein
MSNECSKLAIQEKFLEKKKSFFGAKLWTIWDCDLEWHSII